MDRAMDMARPCGRSVTARAAGLFLVVTLVGTSSATPPSRWLACATASDKPGARRMQAGLDRDFGAVQLEQPMVGSWRQNFLCGDGTNCYDGVKIPPRCEPTESDGGGFRCGEMLIAEHPTYCQAYIFYLGTTAQPLRQAARDSVGDPDSGNVGTPQRNVSHHFRLEFQLDWQAPDGTQHQCPIPRDWGGFDMSYLGDGVARPCLHQVTSHLDALRAAV
jgi:hypothetical protein